MYDETAMIMMLATLTSTHPGSGTELSFVDLPIQREGHTGFPKIEAATLKGSIRSKIREKNSKEEALINCLFGLPDKGEFASAVSLTDSRLLFFPVKSVRGVFGWITCPLVIQRFITDCKLAGKTIEANQSRELEPNEGVIPRVCKLTVTTERGEQVVLEDYTFTVKKDDGFTRFLQLIEKEIPGNSLAKGRILDHALIVSDDDFANFVNHSTEVSTRIRIDQDTGTVAGQALFSEEYLPPECIFYNLLFFTRSHSPQEEETKEGWNQYDVKRKLKEVLPSDTVVQIGADSSLGKGLIQIKYEGV